MAARKKSPSVAEQTRAALAAELDRLAAERDDALARESALAEVLRVINSSSGEPGIVFTTLLEAGARLCKAEQAVITLRDSEDGLFHYGASFGYGEDFKELLIRNPVAPGRTSLIGRTALEGQVVHIEDAAADPDYKWADALRLGRWHTGLGVPLLRDGAVVGTLALTRRRIERFTDKQIELVETFAHQAVIAFENSRLFNELRESEERYGLVSQAVAEGIYEWDVERNSLWVSSRLIEIFGLQGRHLAAADWNDLVHPEDFPKYRAALRDCFKGVTAGLDCEYRVRHGDGQYRWIEDRSIPVRDSSNRAIRLVGAVSDITTRRLADQSLREALEQQTATAEVLSVINSSPGDLAPVFDAMLAKATHLCEAAYGILWSYDGQRMSPSSVSGSPEIAAALHDLGSLEPAPGSLGYRLLQGETVVHIPDAQHDQSYRMGSPSRRILVEVARAHSLLGVALRKDGAVRGLITVYRQEVRPFSDKQIALLQNFATQAVIAMENARLLGELRQRTDALQQALEYQTATAEVLKIVASSPDRISPVFDAMLERATVLCDVEAANLYLHNAGLLTPVAVRHPDPKKAAALLNNPLRPGPTSAITRVLISKAPVHIPDLADDEAYRQGDPFRVRMVDELGVRALLAVPLLRQDEVVGVMAIHRPRPGPFTDNQIELVRTFADQAVIAIENTRLLGELRQRTDDVQEALEYQTSTSDVLQAISRSTFDLDAILQTVVSSAHRLCRADYAVIFRNDGGDYRWAAGHGISAAYEALERASVIRPGTGTLIGRAVLTAEAVHIEDAQTDALYEVKDDARAGGMHSMLGVPLLREGVPIGVIGLARNRIEPFSERETQLVATFADQAVIAIENARLLNETQEALEQQTATAEVLQVINSSPGQLAPVFHAMLERATRLSEAQTGHLFRFENGAFTRLASHGVPEDFDELYPSDTPVPLNPSSIPARMIATRSVVHVRDQREDESYRLRLDRDVVAAVEEAGILTVLFVPLIKEGEVVGHFAMHRMEIRPFTDTQIALLQNFASQAVIAMENARLLNETQEALEQQTATAEVLQVINSSPGNLAPVFDAMIERAARLCEADEAALRTFDGELLHLVAVHGSEPAVVERLRQLGPTPAIGGYEPIGRGEDVAHYSDVRETDIFRNNAVVRQRLELRGIRSWLAVALRKEGALLGVINVHRHEVRPFSDKQIALLQNFAAQAVIAMENARLITETREALEQQTATAEVLQVINRSPGELQPVFDVILEKAMVLCDVSYGDLELYDGDTFRAVATRGLTDAFVEQLRRGYPADDNPATRQLIAGERVSHIVNMADADFSKVFTHEPVKDEGHQTLLCVPLRRENALLGMIACARREVRAFSEKEIALVESFAAQAVIAIENARLLDEIRQRQAELRVTFDNMADGVAMFDAELRLAAWNRNFQELLDLPDEFLAASHRFDDYIRYLAARGEFGDIDPDAELVRLRAQFGDHYSFNRTRPDGRVIEVRHNPMPEGGFVLIYSDITERTRSEAEIRKARDAAEGALRELKAAQASLIQAEKMASLGQLTAGIAHEIKNPLNFVNNFASLSNELLDELKELAGPALAALGDDQRDEVDETIDMLSGNLEKIAEHGKRADNIVKSMLEHSRGVSGERRPVDINALVEEALNLAYHGARAQDQAFNITLERDFDHAVKPIDVVPQDMTRVFLNLFGNGFYAAHKRTRADGDAGFRPILHVATRDEGAAVMVKVRDNGTGIPSAIRDKLFQPFFTTKPTGEGTGLGLSISYDIVVQQHGGTIAVDSEEGAFTEFTIRLPRHGAASGHEVVA